MKNRLVAVFIAVLAMCVAGCGSGGGGGGGSCKLTVTPQNATADHTLPPPGNQVQFTAAQSGSCSSVDVPIWSVSDSTNVSIGTGIEPNNGLATCLGPTSGPVTVTAVMAISPPPSGTATLTCK